MGGGADFSVFSNVVLFMRCMICFVLKNVNLYMFCFYRSLSPIAVRPSPVGKRKCKFTKVHKEMSF